MNEIATRKMSTEKSEKRVAEAASRICHDIKNSVGVLRGFAELLTQDLPAEKKEGMAISIQQAAGELDELTSRLAEFSAPLTLHPKEFSLDTFLEESLEAFKELLPANILFTSAAAGETVIHSDPLILRDALFALLTNAYEAAPKKPIQLHLTSELSIVIRDEGEGFEVEPFELLNSTKGRGRGFGLCQAEKCIATLSGQLQIDSSRKEGCSCTITLPRSL